MNSKYKTILSYTVVIAILGFGAYKYFTRPNISEIFSGNQTAGSIFATGDTPANQQNTNSETLPARTPPAGFKEYRSEAYKFSLFYPESLSVKEYKESGGAQTITFSDNQDEYSFQIFVLPFKENQVTEKRFKMDVPSGVLKEPVDVMIDSIRATAFFSTNAIMGDTREVWFIKNGFLYEVTTYKELDTWLAGIMQSWKFLQ